MTTSHFPRIFTFYSFKGGVGRSMAVMNVAYTLASWGRNVLVLDMDLEAPGFSDFLQRSGELEALEGRRSRDILSLLSEVIRISRNGGEPEELAKDLPTVSNYLRSVKREKLKELEPAMGRLGRLDVIGVDIERDFTARLAKLGLAGRPQHELLAISRVLHFYLKAQSFGNRPLGIGDEEPEESTHYDYVLVDSRTGITEIGGLCVGPLAEHLAVLTGLNDQNVEGTLKFLGETGIQTGRPASPDADALEFASLGPKPTVIVASPVPNGELETKKHRLGEMQRKFGVRPLRLSYHPQLALRETIFVRDFSDEYLAEEYRRLAGHLLGLASDSVQHFANRVQELLQPEGDPRQAIRLLARMAPQQPELAAGFLQVLGSQLMNQDVGNGVPVLIQVCALLTQWKPARLEGLNTWGAALGNLARTKTGEEADQLYASAFTKYEEAVRLNPQHANGWSNWGNDLGGQAGTKTGEEADRLYASAFAKYEEAIRLNPRFAEALVNWGADLSDYAGKKTGEEADRLFASAFTKYEEAIRLNPRFAEAWSNWGTAYSVMAKSKTGELADELYASAYSKYEEAVRLDPLLASAWANWGAALLNQSRHSPASRASTLQEAAHQRLLRAWDLKAVRSPYFLACLSGLRENVRESVEWLLHAKSAGFAMTQQTLAAERDFETVRDHPQFQEFAAKLPSV